MAVDKKFFVDINLQGNALNNATIGSNSDMTKGGSFRFDGTRLEYFDGSSVQSVANLADISAVTGGLILQGGYNAATETPNITSGSALKGFFWVVTEAGSFLGESVQIGDSIIAKVDAAGASISDWLILQGNVVIATDTVDGIVRLATQEEVDAGTEGGAVVLTPATFESSQQLSDLREDITSLSNDKLARDGNQSMTGDLDMDGNKVINVSAPIVSTDAANKDYVDTQARDAQDAAEATASADATAKADAAQAAAETYADGVALTAENNAKAYADSLAPNYDAAGSATTAENNAKAYADSLAPNYDAAGAAATAESNANSYTDSAISQEVTDRNSAIATAKGEAIADANSYTDGEIAQEVIDRDAAIATAKSEAIADANSYTDTGLALKLDLTGGTMSGTIDMSDNIIGNATIENAVLANPLNANGQAISNLENPKNAQDAATKSYVDAQFNAVSFSDTFADTAWTLAGGVYSLEVAHNIDSSTPKVSSYVSGNLVEFAVEASNSNTIVLKSNIAAPAYVSVGVSK
jgi:hypothetical protein